MLELIERERIDLTVVGPELPLERGVADRCRAAGHAIVGPSQYGAALECSKRSPKISWRGIGFRLRASSCATS